MKNSTKMTDYQYADRLYKKLKKIIDGLDYGDLCYELKIAVLSDLVDDYKKQVNKKKLSPINLFFIKD